MIYATVNCVFDEVLIFNIKKCAKETFEDAIIKVTVMDANSVPLQKNTEIGSFATDATSVYFSKDHEMYRKWVALMDDDNPEDTGTYIYMIHTRTNTYMCTWMHILTCTIPSQGCKVT